MTIILLGFMIYPDLNLVMKSIRTLNKNEITLNFRLIYFMTYTVQFPRICTFMTWRWPRAGAETCRQFKITTTNKLNCVLTHLKPSPYLLLHTTGMTHLTSACIKYIFCRLFPYPSHLSRIHTHTHADIYIFSWKMWRIWKEVIIYIYIYIQKPHIPASFNMYLVINKCVTAVKVSNFSGHYLRNRSTLDIGVLGYIDIV